MRIALALHAFPPRERTGVETYSEALARALVAAGHRVEVFAPGRDPHRAHLTQQREERGGVGVTWLGLEADADHAAERRAIPGAAEAFGRFLDREQPELVHFQHVYKLGAEAIEVARARDLPVAFTGHDPFPICNDYTLLALDLSPLDPLDRQTLARNEMARGLLDRHLAAHDGFLPVGEDGTELARRVAELLHGDAADASELAWRAARIGEEVDARLVALARADRIETPTRWLAELYRSGGLDAEVAVRPCGIDTANLAGVPPLDGKRAGPLSVLYLGGYYEHKGVHVLLEAIEPLGEAVRLTLRGCAGSSSYLPRLEERARAVGAELGGPFDRDELPDLLSGADLVVLPSIWPENAPFVIREAFAAGRPVVASDTPALRESLRDGVDGRLFPAGDTAALGAILAELSADREALVALAAGIRPPLTIEEDARQLVELYRPLVQAREEQSQRRRERLPEHLREFDDRYRALSRSPGRELLDRALAGLPRVGEFLGFADEDPTPVAGSRQSTRLRERFAAAQRAAEWQARVTLDREERNVELRGRLEQVELHAAELARRGSWLEGLLAEREGRIEWQEEVIADRTRAVEAGDAELAGAGRRHEALESRLEELGRAVEALSSERDWLAAGRREHEERADWLERTLAGREEELSSARGAVEELRAQLAEVERAFEHTASDREALRAHEAWLRAELSRVLGPLFGRELAAEPEAIAELCADALERLLAMQRDLAWRAEQMRGAALEGEGLLQRWIGGALRRRVGGWPR